ncbi:uncharacterized protein [Physcomitrium patens]|nr:uncharacterized protein LOC112278425 isoform X2 [Physcomitrium patens]|eukprot:XP_024367673.1 uncharacterized protein LOC112278425 isoform X2 [Physcomitrella patens]
MIVQGDAVLIRNLRYSCETSIHFCDPVLLLGTSDSPKSNPLRVTALPTSGVVRQIVAMAEPGGGIIPQVVSEYKIDPVVAENIRAVYPVYIRKGGNKTQIPQSSVATIMRGVGFNPSEAQIEDIITACKMKEESQTQRGYFECDNFEQQVAGMMFNNPGCLNRLPKEKVLKALNTIWLGRETLEPEELKSMFRERGDKFTVDEASSMVRAAQDSDTKLIYLDDWAELLSSDGIIAIPPSPNPLPPIKIGEDEEFP